MIGVPIAPCSRSAAPSPSRMPVVTHENCRAARSATRLANGLARRPRNALISSPVSMPTGHAVAHKPQAAQVSIPW